MYFTYQLPAFFIGIIGNGTGVNYIHIGKLIKMHREKKTLQGYPRRERTGFRARAVRPETRR